MHFKPDPVFKTSSTDIPGLSRRRFSPHDRWIGSTEANLERIFHLLHGSGRCVVFINVADQILGKRASGANHGGL